jgi:hypothetical protein
MRKGTTMIRNNKFWNLFPRDELAHSTKGNSLIWKFENAANLERD